MAQQVTRQTVLVGFSGAGKSTAGESASDKLQVPHYDTDRRIEAMTGRTTGWLIQNQGEPRFREYEREAIASILTAEPGVVSTGGGIISTALGRKALKGSEANVIYLDAPYDMSIDRCAKQTGQVRPLLTDAEAARLLFQTRRPLYQEVATHTVDASQPFDMVVDQIVEIARSPA